MREWGNEREMEREVTEGERREREGREKVKEERKVERREWERCREGERDVSGLSQFERKRGRYRNRERGREREGEREGVREVCLVYHSVTRESKR
jgi:hypothetical protein